MDLNKINGLTITGIVIAVCIFLFTLAFACYLLAWGVLMGGAYIFSENPGEPQIKTAEFPFRLEYELDGEVFVAEDVYICEFKGYEFSSGTGEKYRVWKGRFKSGKTRITLLSDDGIEIFYFPISKKNSSGLAGKYMGDPEHTKATVGNFPDAHYTVDFADERFGRYIISAEEMWTKYKLRLISWDMADPIENVFE